MSLNQIKSSLAKNLCKYKNELNLLLKCLTFYSAFSNVCSCILLKVSDKFSNSVN